MGRASQCKHLLRKRNGGGGGGGFAIPGDEHGQAHCWIDVSACMARLRQYCSQKEKANSVLLLNKQTWMTGVPNNQAKPLQADCLFDCA